MSIFHLYFIEVCSGVSNWLQTRNGSGNVEQKHLVYRGIYKPSDLNVRKEIWLIDITMTS